MEENEFRVRPVRRYVVTHFNDGPNGSSCCQYGEFDNQRQAETVARALHVANPGSTFQTIMPAPEPCGVFYAATPAQAEALMKFIHSDGFPAA